MALLIVYAPSDVQTTMLDANQPTYNYGIATDVSAGYYTGTANRRGLLRFDISALPVGATIVSAEVRMYCRAEDSTTDRDVAFHRALTEWYEGLKNGAAPDGGTDGSTWNLRNANGSVAWAGGAGGGSGSDYAAVATATTTITAQSTYFAWDVTADVQAWYAGTATNYGWWMINSAEGTNSSAKKFYTEDWTNDPERRPMLFIEYTTGSNTSDLTRVTADTAIAENNATYNYGITTILRSGNASTNTTTNRMLVAGSVAGVPAGATIVNASLWLYGYDETNTTDEDIGIHRALTQWYEGLKNGAAPDGGTDGSTWNLRNANGSVAWAGGAGGGSGSDYAAVATDTVAFTSPALWYEFDVTADVAAFVAGTATNYGWWLINTDEANANTGKRFCAIVQSGGSTSTGILAIDYTTAAEGSYAGELTMSGEWSGVYTPPPSAGGRNILHYLTGRI